MKHWLKLLVLPLFAAALWAQPATTTVADTLYAAIGGPTYCTGSITLSWSTFYSQDGFLIQGGTSAPIVVSSMGAFSVAVVPTNTTTTPASGIYQVRYNVQPSQCAPASEYWNVPSSMSPVDLNMVRTLPTPPPSLIPITSLYPSLLSGTYELCSVNFIIQWGTCGAAGGGITGSGTTGKLAKFTASTVIGNAASADIITNFTGCSGTQYLGADGACHTTISQLTSAAIIALWTGCSGTLYLGADGACHSASGGTGTVTTFSAGTLSPLFTTSVATATTTPALTFILTNANALTFFGNPTGSAAGPIYMTATQATAGLNLFSSSLQGLTPASGGGTTNFLRADGTWAVPPGSGSPAFSAITSGTNTTAAMLCGSGCTFTPTGTGVIDATQVQGASPATSATVAATNSMGQIIAATVQGNGAKAQLSTGTTTTNDCVKFDANGNTVDAGSACGAGGVASFFQALTAPVAANFTSLNFNTGTGVTTTQVNGSAPVPYITLRQQDPSHTGNLVALYKAKIAATFTVTVGLTFAADTTTGMKGGLFLKDSGNNNLIFGWYYAPSNTYFPAISSATATLNAGSGSGNHYYPGSSPWPQGPVLWLRIQETASARNYYFSSDGVTFYQIYTESNTAFMTTADYGFGLYYFNAGGDGGITLYSFTETNP